MLSTRQAGPPKVRGKIPTLRTIEDAKGFTDLDKVVNLAKLYELGIDNGHDEHNNRAGVWHPSSCGYCMRAQVLQYQKVAPTDRQSKYLKEIFEIGHLHHDVIQRRLASIGVAVKKHGLNYEFEKEVPYDPQSDQLFLEFGIGGTCDGLLRIWNAYFEQRGVLEAKSQSNDRHEKLQQMPSAWPTHLLQAHVYAYRFNVPLIWVFYTNKNNQKRDIRVQLYNEEIFDAALAYFVTAADFVERGELPPREESWFECKECVYRTLCQPAVLKKKRRSLPTVPTTGLRRR